MILFEGGAGSKRGGEGCEGGFFGYIGGGGEGDLWFGKGGWFWRGFVGRLVLYGEVEM